jgi:hypothetical protein
MNRDQSAASRAAVFRVLFNDECIDPLYPDFIQIPFHAHVVVFTVPVVDTIDLFARIQAAFGTQHSLASGNIMIDSRAFPEQIGAFPIPRPAADTLASIQIVHIRKIPAAHRAIHSARRDKFFWYGIRFFHLKSIDTIIKFLLIYILIAAPVFFSVDGDVLRAGQNKNRTPWNEKHQNEVNKDWMLFD